MENLLAALTYVLQPYHIGVVFFGTLIGILVGAMPGLSSIMGLSIMMPLTLSLDGNAGMLMLLGVFCGAIYGGSITAILIKTPGTANSAATVLDGYPMATKLHQPGRAISISTMASTFGGLFSAVMLLWTAPLLSKFALKFGAAEYFALAMFGLSMVTSISSKNVIKGLIGAVLGLMMATIGMNSLTGSARFTFGSVYLMGGIAMVPTLIALYAFSQGLSNIEDGGGNGKPTSKAKLERILPTWSDIKATFPTILRSSIIGTIIGAIPGTGGDIASWVGYNEAKRWSKHPEKFGEGVPEGIAAPEAANNAISGGALIPLLTLGIPGDAGTAVMLSALMMQGVVPGPHAVHGSDRHGLYDYRGALPGQYLHVRAGLRSHSGLCQNWKCLQYLSYSHCVCLLRCGYLCAEQQHPGYFHDDDFRRCGVFPDQVRFSHASHYPWPDFG